MSTRKNVSWRVVDSPQSEAINKWLDEQKNIQDSITNIVLHMIERFGIRNITDYDIQKMLYQEVSTLTIKQSAEDTVVHVAHEGQDIEDRRPKGVEKTTKPDIFEQAKSDDDMYNELDINNL